MLNYLNTLGIQGTIFVIIITVLMIVEIIKALSYLFNFISAQTSKGKKIFLNRKTLDAMTVSNSEGIQEVKELQKTTNEALNDFMKSQMDVNAMQQEINATQITFINNQEIINEKLSKEMNEVKDRLEDISTTVISSQLQQMRTIILEFASICNTRRFTKERFSSVNKTYEEYESIIKKRNLVNSEIDASYKVIFDEYQRCIAEHDFLEDHNGEAIREKPVLKSSPKPRKKVTKKKNDVDSEDSDSNE